MKFCASFYVLFEIISSVAEQVNDKTFFHKKLKLYFSAWKPKILKGGCCAVILSTVKAEEGGGLIKRARSHFSTSLKDLGIYVKDKNY